MYGHKIVFTLLCCMIFFICPGITAQDAEPPPGELPLVDPENPVYVKGIVSENGIPAVDARVWIGPYGPVVTGENGRYSYTMDVPLFSVHALTREGEFIGEVTVQCQAGKKEYEVNFDFEPAYIQGVIKENGRGLGKSKVFIGKNFPVKTDISGFYKVKVQSGQVRIFVVSPAGEFIHESIMTVNKNEYLVLDYDFSPGEIEVTVMQDEKPVKDAKVLAGRNAPVLTDHEGKCLLKVKPGNVEVLVLYPGKEPTVRKRITVESNKRVALDF
ncbi:MAG: carboxypeptidase regulatory-like domain-containing protein [Spirochaetales bacterium]|nr:carboxypeptidase regulatory-like domain-containing protein [Spirochaetales bacterium]